MVKPSITLCVLLLLSLLVVLTTAQQQSTCTLATNTRFVNLVGNWREGSGKIWTCVQHGNHFTWTQQGTNRKATGIIVAPCSVLATTAYITFDNNVHWKVSISSDGETIRAGSETFTKMNASQPTAQPRGFYSERSGRTWSVTSSSCHGFSLRNQQDGRTADGSYSTDYTTGLITIYVNFHDASGDTLLRAVTPNMDIWQLSNGDVFRRVL